MPRTRRTPLAKLSRKQSVGGMRDRVVVQTRGLNPPLYDDPSVAVLEFQETSAVWVSINTETGKVQFAGSTLGDQVVTHTVVMRFDPAVTTETWLLTQDGRRLDVLSVEALDEREGFLLLSCMDKGSQTLATAGR